MEFQDLDILQKCGGKVGERKDCRLWTWGSKGTLRSKAGFWWGSRGGAPGSV